PASRPRRDRRNSSGAPSALRQSDARPRVRPPVSPCRSTESFPRSSYPPAASPLHGEIELAVPVDVHRGKADIVLLRLPLNQDVLIPVWILQPQNPLLVHNADIEPLVA